MYLYVSFVIFRELLTIRGSGEISAKAMWSMVSVAEPWIHLTYVFILLYNCILHFLYCTSDIIIRFPFETFAQHWDSNWTQHCSWDKIGEDPLARRESRAAIRAYLERPNGHLLFGRPVCAGAWGQCGLKGSRYPWLAGAGSESGN